MREAKELIESLLAEDESVPEFEFGAILTAKVVEIRERGILVELHPNMDPVMVHVSQLSATKVHVHTQRQTKLLPRFHFCFSVSDPRSPAPLP